MSLTAMRQHVGLLQADVGKRMGMSQSQVSRLERRTDLKLSTLAAYVEALGGELQLRISFDEGADDVVVVHLGGQEI